MSNSMETKIRQLKKRFALCKTPEETYSTIITLGRELPSLPPEEKVEENQVYGCQSTVYLSTKRNEDRLFFSANADALISAGLAHLLVTIYSGEEAETILTSPPTYLEELGIPGALSPSRANGLYSMHLRMKQEALQATVLLSNLSKD